MKTEPNGLSIHTYKKAMKRTYEIIRNEAMKHPFPIGSYPKDREEYFRYNMNAAWLAFIILAGFDDGLHYYSWADSRKELEDYWDSLSAEGIKMIKNI